jgi:hypothetical protein
MSKVFGCRPPTGLPCDVIPWVTGHFKKLATAIFRATPLTAEETEEVAQVVEMGAMKAWVECERAKGRADLRSHSSNCVRELGSSVFVFLKLVILNDIHPTLRIGAGAQDLIFEVRYLIRKRTSWSTNVDQEVCPLHEFASPPTFARRAPSILTKDDRSCAR